jgi:hypothetical protein
MVAKHGRKKNYCSVCRVDYEDYLTVLLHTFSTSRISLIDGNSGPTNSANSLLKPSRRWPSPGPPCPSCLWWRRSFWMRQMSPKKPHRIRLLLRTDVFCTFLHRLSYIYHRFSLITSSARRDRPYRSRTPLPAIVHDVKALPYCQKVVIF